MPEGSPLRPGVVAAFADGRIDRIDLTREWRIEAE
jgi:hypothetical protein